MKTVLIQLESHDDVISITDKISWVKSPRVILEFPKKQPPELSVLDMQLIARRAKDQGSQILVVSKKGRIIENSEVLGIPVFSSVLLANHATIIPNQESHPEQIIPQGAGLLKAIKESIPVDKKNREGSLLVQVTSIIVVIAVFTVLLLLALPTATIVVYPATETQSINLGVTASTQVGSSSLSGLIPAESQLITVSGDASANSTGKVEFPLTKARGTVEFSTQSSTPVVILSGSVVAPGKEPAIRFVLLEDVTLNAVNGETATGEVEAILPGQSGNIDAGQLSMVEGLLGSSITVINPESFSGGTSKMVPSPTEQDYMLLKAELLKKLKTDVQNQTLQFESDDLRVVENSLTFDEILSEYLTNPIGGASDTLSIRLTVSYRFLTYRPDDLSTMLDQILDASIPKGYRVVNGSLAYSNSGDVQIVDDIEASWHVIATRKITKTADEEQIKALVAGKSFDTASQFIQDMSPQIKPPFLSGRPGFWKILPFIPARITMEEQY